MQEFAQITLRRDKGHVDRLRAYQVKLDGKVLGHIREGQEATFQISPGRHVLSVAIDWCGSPPLEIDAAPACQLTFECGSNLRGPRAVLALWYVLVRRDQYLWLRPVTEGR